MVLIQTAPCAKTRGDTPNLSRYARGEVAGSCTRAQGVCTLVQFLALVRRDTGLMCGTDQGSVHDLPAPCARGADEDRGRAHGDPRRSSLPRADQRGTVEAGASLRDDGAAALAWAESYLASLRARRGVGQVAPGGGRARPPGSAPGAPGTLGARARALAAG